MDRNNQLFILQEEKISRAIMKLAIPSILTSLVGVIYNVIDTVYISQLHNNSMIAATTVAMPLMIILQSFGDAIGMGASSYVGRLLGMNRQERAYRTIKTAMTVALGVSLVVSIGMILLLDPLLSLFSTEESVTFFAKQYMTIILLGGVFATYKQILSNILRAQGQIKVPMIAIIVGVVLNIVLNPIFMFEWGLNMKVQGAALATILSQFIAMCIMLQRLGSNKVIVPWKMKDFGFDLSCFQEIVRVGSAAFVRQILPSASFSFMVTAASVYGTDFLATMGIAKKSLQIVTAIFMGYAHGIQPFLAYNYGAKNKERIIKVMRFSTVFVVLFGLAMSVVFALRGDWIIGMYIQDANIIGYGELMLIGYACSFPILGVYQVYASSLQAFGKSKESFWLSVSKQGFFYIPLIIILPKIFGMAGIYATQPVTDWLTFIMLIFLCRKLPQQLKALDTKDIPSC